MSMTIEDIKRVSADECGVMVSDIDGRGRLRKVSLARQIAIYFTRKMHGVVETGKHFGRVHSNISHTCKRVEAFIECDREYSEIIKKVGTKLG
jgi:chromosomal replication initiator protein